jgi:hypothetical protein
MLLGTSPNSSYQPRTVTAMFAWAEEMYHHYSTNISIM